MISRAWQQRVRGGRRRPLAYLEVLGPHGRERAERAGEAAISREALGDLWRAWRGTWEAEGIAQPLVQRAIQEATSPDADFVLGAAPETWSPLAELRFESLGSLASDVQLFGALAADTESGSDDAQLWPRLDVENVVVDESPALTFAIDGDPVAAVAFDGDAFLLPIPSSVHAVGIEVEPRPATISELERLMRAPAHELVVWRIYSGENSWVRDVITRARRGVHQLSIAGLEIGAFAAGRVVRTRSKTLDADRPDPFRPHQLAKAESENHSIADAAPRLGASGTETGRAVVVVHGTMSNGLALAKAVLDASGNEVPVRRYEHDTWLALETNAAELATLLADKVRENVALVAHSRGGLVATRAMTILERRGGPAVTSLTTLGTPFSGTPVAASADLAFLGLRALMGGLRYAGGPTVDAATRLAGLALRLRTPPGLKLMFPNSPVLPVLRDAIRPDAITFAAEADGWSGNQQGPGLARGLGNGVFGDVANDLVVAVDSAQVVPGPPVLACDHYSYLDSAEVRACLDFRNRGF